MEDRICKIGNSPPESLEPLGGSHPTSVLKHNTLPVLAFSASTLQWQITELQPSPVDLKKNQWGSVFLRRLLPAGVSQCCPFLHFLPWREKGSSRRRFAWNMFCTKKSTNKRGNSPPESLEPLRAGLYPQPFSVLVHDTLPFLAFLASTLQWQITELHPSPVDLKKKCHKEVFLAVQDATFLTVDKPR